MTKYTISGKSDGFGAQYQSIMSGIAYCNYMNYQYIHTPMKILSHGTIWTRMVRFCYKWSPPNLVLFLL